MCLMMALDYKIRRVENVFYPSEAYEMAVSLIQEELVLMEPGFPKGSAFPVIEWNDNPKRKKKEVIGLLDRAIVKASA